MMDERGMRTDTEPHPPPRGAPWTGLDRSTASAAGKLVPGTKSGSPTRKRRTLSRLTAACASESRAHSATLARDLNRRG